MATPCPPDITCWWLSGVPYLGSGRKSLSVFTRLKCSRAWGSLVRISAQAWGGDSVVCGVLCCSWAFGFHALSFIPNPEKRIPLPTYRTLYQEFITATTVIELGFSFVKYVVSSIHFEVLCVHLWFPVDRLSRCFSFLSWVVQHRKMDRSRLQLKSPSSVMKLEIGCLFVLVLYERSYRLSILKPPGSVQFFLVLQSLVICMNVHSPLYPWGLHWQRNHLWTENVIQSTKMFPFVLDMYRFFLLVTLGW